MKNLLTAAVFFAAVSSAHAAGPAGHAAAPAATPAATEAPAAPAAEMQAKKMDKKTAAAECKKEGVKGKEMKACVAKKTM